jgi:phage shock protein PspC (stress-responsive transcriptional regulator)
MQDTVQGTQPPSERPPEAPARVLTRSHDRMLGGVAGGLADYFDLDPTIVRLALVLTALVSSGIVVIAYVAMWIIMPEAPSSIVPGLAAAPPAAAGRSGVNGAMVLGLILVAAGGFALLDRFPLFHMFGWGMARVWWPALLIAVGLALIFARARDHA